MPEKPQENAKPFFPPRFQVVQTIVDLREVLRDPHGALVFPSGHVKLNTAASEGIRNQASPKFKDLTKCGILWAADAEQGELAGALVPPTTKGVTGIREVKDGLLTATFRGVLKEKPLLRPETKKWVSVTFHDEEATNPYFVLHLNIALPQIKQRKKRSSKKASGNKDSGNKDSNEKPTEPEADVTEPASE
ncbi:MAG TPA: hypothetical protein VD969_03115 [Symbiobacteriaceae bacterium]|nr:hypothetical protein [Symbiobacteriaceae bacterium]